MLGINHDECTCITCLFNSFVLSFFSVCLHLKNIFFWYSSTLYNILQVSCMFASLCVCVCVLFDVYVLFVLDFWNCSFCDRWYPIQKKIDGGLLCKFFSKWSPGKHRNTIGDSSFLSARCSTVQNPSSWSVYPSFALVHEYILILPLAHSYFFSYTSAQQNVSHSNTNNAIGFDKSILFYFHKSSRLFITRQNLYTLFFLFFFFLFCSIKAFRAIYLASRVSFRTCRLCIGRSRRRV